MIAQVSWSAAHRRGDVPRVTGVRMRAASKVEFLGCYCGQICRPGTSYDIERTCPECLKWLEDLGLA